MPLSAMRVVGRVTQGVKLIKMSDKDEIASIAKILHEDDVEEILLDENGIPIVSDTAIDEINPTEIQAPESQEFDDQTPTDNSDTDSNETPEEIV